MAENTEIIPSLELPGLPVALGEMDTLQTHIEGIGSQIRAMSIDKREDYEKMADLVTKLKSADKSGVSTMSPLKNAVNKVRDFLLTRERKLANRIEEFRGIANAKMGEWTRKEQLAAKAEQERINAEARKKAEAEAAAKLKQEQEEAAKRKKDAIAEIKRRLKAGEIGKREAAKLLKEAGDTEQADILRAEAEATEIKENPQTIKVESQVPTVAGIQKRVNYRAECTDTGAFLKEFARRYAKGDISLLPYVTVDQQAIGKFARDTKDSKKVAESLPYVKAWEDRTF